MRVVLGGYIALHALQANPERIEALVLCDTQCSADSAEAREKRLKSIASIRLGGINHYVEEMLQHLFAPSTFKSNPEEISFIKGTILCTNHDSICKTLLALANRRASCLELREITVPVLIMVGREDKITPIETAIRMHNLIPGSAIEIIENAGHLTNLENSEAFNARLASFLVEL